jgi:hypothetical protein
VYEAFYGLKVKPFALSPQEEFMFLSRQHRMALELLVYGLRNRQCSAPSLVTSVRQDDTDA